MKALVLAAGSATRLSPLSEALPKPLIPIANRPVMEHLIERIRRAGITEVGVVYHAKSQDLRRYFEGGEFGVEFTWLLEQGPRGTGGALRDSRDFIGFEPVLVLHCDLVSTVNLVQMMEHHLRHPAIVTVAASERDPRLWHGDYVEVLDGRAIAYHYQPPRPTPYALGTCGTWILEPPALDLVPDGFSDFNRDVLARLPTPDHHLGVFDAGVIYHRDVGVFQSFHEGNLDAVRGLAGIELPVPLDGAEGVVRGPVLIGADVILGHGVQIFGPAVIGPGVTVGACAKVIASVLLPGARLAAFTTLAMGVLGETGNLVENLLNFRDKAPADRLVVTGHTAEWYRH